MNASFFHQLHALTVLTGIAGRHGNQVVGGLLLQTTRNSIVKSCQQRFSKFETRCTYTQRVYDAETGDEVFEANVTDGLAPYGVDAVFLSTSSEYDASLSVGRSLCTPKQACESCDMAVTWQLATPLGRDLRNTSRKLFSRCLPM